MMKNTTPSTGTNEQSTSNRFRRRRAEDGSSKDGDVLLSNENGSRKKDGPRDSGRVVMICAIVLSVFTIALLMHERSVGLQISSYYASTMSSSHSEKNVSSELDNDDDEEEKELATLEQVRASFGSLLELLVDRCDGEKGVPLSYWTYRFDCPMNGTFLSSDHQDEVMAAGKETTNHAKPKVVIGDTIFFYGHMLDFLVAELFFLHPRPVTKGRFLEIGAYNGLEFTNTLFFEHYLDWGGWLFEPTAVCYEKCVASRPKASVFQMGLCNSSKMVKVAGYGSTCKTNLAPCEPLLNVSSNRTGEAHVTEGFDLVSVDIEGGEMSILQAIDFQSIPVKVLIVEWRNGNGSQRQEYLKQFGYALVGRLYNKGWQVGDEIYYRPDLVRPHLFSYSSDDGETTPPRNETEWPWLTFELQ